jgi:hypothetical protein
LATLDAPAKTSARWSRLVWVPTLLLVLIGLAAVARRLFVFVEPPRAPRFAAGAAVDATFATHPLLTLIHILPAALLIVLMTMQFVPGIRARHLGWHRWSGRLIIVLGFVVGISALVMSYSVPIGGANETAATTFFAVLFLIFLLAGFRSAQKRRIVQHRQWMLRAFGVVLGIATTRPIMGAFFAARRFSPHEFFGIAFWLGFSTTLLGAEAWIHVSERHSFHA